MTISMQNDVHIQHSKRVSKIFQLLAETQQRSGTCTFLRCLVKYIISGLGIRKQRQSWGRFTSRLQQKKEGIEEERIFKKMEIETETDSYICATRDNTKDRRQGEMNVPRGRDRVKMKKWNWWKWDEEMKCIKRDKMNNIKLKTLKDWIKLVWI